MADARATGRRSRLVFGAGLIAIVVTGLAACGGQSAPTGASSDGGFTMGKREWIAALERTADGGAVLTNDRLLLKDGNGWRECWHAIGSAYAGLFQLVTVDQPLVAIAADGMLWTSTDDCRSWGHTPLPPESMALSFPSPETGFVVVSEWAAGRETARTYRTGDGGATWTAMSGKVSALAVDGGTFHGFLGLSFSDGEHGLLSSYTTLWATDDGAGRWSPKKLPGPPDPGLSAPVTGPDGSAAIAASTPGKLTFYRRDELAGPWAVAATLPDDTSELRLQTDLHSPSFWVARDSGTFHATSDGGHSWTTTSVVSGWPFGASKSSFADPLHGWLVVAEPGSTCPEPTALPGSSANDVCDYGPIGPQHLEATDDGGATWHEVLH